MITKALSKLTYDKWNNIPHYAQTNLNGRGPCEPGEPFMHIYAQRVITYSIILFKVLCMNHDYEGKK